MAPLSPISLDDYSGRIDHFLQASHLMSGTPPLNETMILVLCLPGEAAPEATLTSVRPGPGFHGQLDFDSLDFPNFLVALRQKFQHGSSGADSPTHLTLNGGRSQLPAARS